MANIVSEFRADNDMRCSVCQYGDIYKNPYDPEKPFILLKINMEPIPIYACPVCGTLKAKVPQ